MMNAKSWAAFLSDHACFIPAPSRPHNLPAIAAALDQLEPATVVVELDANEDATFIIRDGNHRMAAAKAAGRTHYTARVLIGNGTDYTEDFTARIRL